MLWLVTFAAVAQGGIKYLPPKPAVGCSNQCVGGYASTPYDLEGFGKFLAQFTVVEAKVKQFSQYHCTKPGLSQIVTTTECTAAAQVVGQSKLPAVDDSLSFCVSTANGNSAPGGDYAVRIVDAEWPAILPPTSTALCHCRSCDEPSTSLQSPWWTVLGIALGVCFAGGAVAAARA